MFVFADRAQILGIANVSIANANPGEHGFYRHMGFHYDPVAYLANFNLNPVAMGALTNVPLNNGTVAQMIRVQVVTPLIGDTGLIRTRSEVSCEKVVGTTQRWTCVG